MKIIYFQCLFHSGAPARISRTESERQIRRRQSLFKDEALNLEKMTGSRLFVKRVRFTDQIV